MDLDDFNVENAYFRSFEIIVRRQLDPVWHQVGPKTKQLVNDLGILRRLLQYVCPFPPTQCFTDLLFSYLLTYDPLQFHAYLETLIASNTITVTGAVKQHQSPWMLTDAANVIFQSAQRRCYTISSAVKPKRVIDLTEDDDAWEALAEAEGVTLKGKGKETDARPGWLPEGFDPVLEELPKWNLLSEIILEAEGEMIRQDRLKKPGSTCKRTSLNRLQFSDRVYQHCPTLRTRSWSWPHQLGNAIFSPNSCPH